MCKYGDRLWQGGYYRKIFEYAKLHFLIDFTLLFLEALLEDLSRGSNSANLKQTHQLEFNLLALSPHKKEGKKELTPLLGKLGQKDSRPAWVT